MLWNGHDRVRNDGFLGCREVVERLWGKARPVCAMSILVVEGLIVRPSISTIGKVLASHVKHAIHFVELCAFGLGNDKVTLILPNI